MARPDNLLRGLRLAVLAVALSGGAVAACGGLNSGRPAVSLTLVAPKAAPRDASVYIDEEFVGPLAIVAARGVRLPAGEHRITVEKLGYFPWDALVVAERTPLRLDVVLEPLPD